SLDPLSPPALGDTLSESLGVSDVPLDNAGATSLALAHRPELAAEAARLKRDQTERSAISAERWPRLGVNADWGVSGQHWADAFPTYEVGLALSLPIFDGFERESRIAERAAGIRKIELREKDLRDRITAEVKSTLLDLESGRDQLEVARERVRLAEEEMNQA